MAWENFIPEIWSAQFVVQTQKKLVFAGPQICNHDYEGEISAYGDTVNITSVGDVTVSDYDDDTDIDYEDVPTSSQKLTVDQQKMFAVGIKDIDKAQARNGGAAVAQIMQTAAYRMSDTADQFVANLLYDGTSAGNVLTAVTDFTTDKGTAYNTLVDLGTAMDEADIPTEGRYVVIPPWYHALLRKDPNFINANKSGSTAPLLNGEVGEAAGFSVLKSNNTKQVSPGTTYNVQAGVAMATSFANNLIEHEVMRDQKRFRDLMRGLHVYGGKVTYPDGLARVTCTRPS